MKAIKLFNRKDTQRNITVYFNCFKNKYSN